MTTTEAMKLADEFTTFLNSPAVKPYGTSKVDVYLTATRMVFTSAATGDHSLDLAASDEDRVRTHFKGYCDNVAAECVLGRLYF